MSQNSSTSDFDRDDVLNNSSNAGSRGARIPLAERSPSRRLGGVIASCRRRAGIGTVIKTLRLGGGKGDANAFPVNVGRDALVARLEGPQQKRKLGISLLGGCSSKGCPTKSDENEDRYVHGKLSLALEALRGGVGERTACWAFATFDGHAGPACSQYLKENFMAHLKKCARAVAQEWTKKAAAAAARREAAATRRADATSSPLLHHEAAVHSSSGDGDGRTSGEDEDEDEIESGKAGAETTPTEVVLARLLTDTLASLTRSFEKQAILEGEISGACVISGLYCEGALVLANIGDCQAVYHGQVKSAPGAPVTAQTTIHDASNPAEVNRVLATGGFMSSTGRFQGVLEPSRTIGDVDVKAEAPKGAIASFPELFKVDIASDVFRDDEAPAIPPFLVLATDGIWDETSASTVVAEVKDGIGKIQAHKRRFMVRKDHRRTQSAGSTTFTDGESGSEDESEFCGSGEWAERGMDLAERVVSLARGRYDDATALVVVFE